MGLVQQFQQHLQTRFLHLHTKHSKILLAVSGGVDSVVLTDLVAKAGYDFIIAHCNFQLRGNESNRDEQFVRALGDKYSKPVLVQHFDTNAYAQQHKLSIQEAARKLRYGWFAEVVNRQSSIVHKNRSGLQEQTPNNPGSDKMTENTDGSPFTVDDSRFTIATAHHANDNIETLVINFFRGTGISGLHGIPAQQNYIIRPLLFAKREEIMDYAVANGLQWVEDSSNASDKYTRNFIRHQVLPIAKEIFPQAEDNLLQNIERFKEAEQLYAQAIEVHKKKLLEQKGSEWHIPILKLQKATPLQTIVWEVVREFGFSAPQVSEVLKLMQAVNGSYVASSTHRIINNRGWLIIAPLQGTESQHLLIEKEEKKMVFEAGALQFDMMPATQSDISSDASVAMLDAKNIQFPLLLRKWKQGDYFYPLGMQKKKKLSRFFIDQKLSALDKERTWVIEMNKKIIWVVGLRIDDRFKLTASTQKILRVRLYKN